VLVKASHRALEVSRLILTLCGQSAEKGITIEKDNNPLQGLAFKDICQALSLIANSYLFVKYGRRIRVGTDNFTCHEAYCRAYDIFSDWPVNYHRFLQWVKRRGKTEIRHSNYNSRIAEECDRRELHFILIATEDFIENNEVNPVGAVLKSAPSSKRFLDMKEACQRLGTKQECLERLISQGKIEAIMKRGDSQFLIDNESITKLFESLSHLISAQQATRYLNITLDEIESIILEGCLCPLSGPTVDGLPGWRFERQGIDELLEKLRQRLPVDKLTSREKLKSTTEVFHQLKIHGLSSGQFIRAVIEGKIAPRTEKSSYRGLLSHHGLARFHFLSTHVKKFIRNLRQKEKRLPTYVKYVTEFLKRKKEQNDRMFTNRGKEEMSADVIGLHLMIKEVDVRRYSY
jgi:excisionase family DNA binding protein